MNSGSWVSFRPSPEPGCIPGRRGYCHVVTCKNAVSKTSGIPENFFHRFQTATDGVSLGMHEIGTCGFTHEVSLDRVLNVSRKHLKTRPKRGQGINGEICRISGVDVDIPELGQGSTTPAPKTG